MTSDEFPDPTQVEGAPHPRETLRLYGQSRAEQAFLGAFARGRLHHAWLITGPRGVGKATLAWRIAKFLLCQPEDTGQSGMFGAPEPATSLDADLEAPAVRRLKAGAEPRVFALKRGLNDSETGLSKDIRIDEIRKAKSFLQLSSADGGRRVVVIDAAEDMNTAAANALLKLLEEPPLGVVFLLVCHQPAQLLPTIRSRCRELRLTPLGAEDMARALDQAGLVEASDPDVATALTALAEGSVGEAVRLVHLDGLTTYADLIELLTPLPRLDRPRAIRLADSAAGKANEARLDLIVRLIDIFLARLAKGGLFGPPVPPATLTEPALIARLAPNGAAAMKWAALAQTLSARATHARAVNLDPAALVMDMLLEMTAAAA